MNFHVFVEDEAFTLRTDFLKPFNQREINFEKKIFNTGQEELLKIFWNNGCTVQNFPYTY